MLSPPYHINFRSILIKMREIKIDQLINTFLQRNSYFKLLRKPKNQKMEIQLNGDVGGDRKGWEGRSYQILTKFFVIQD